MVRLVVLVAAAALLSCATSEPGASDATTDTAVIDTPPGDGDATDAPADATDAAIDAIDAPGGPDACVPTSELCNGRDDDCDLVVDNGFPTVGMGCMAGVGACAQTGTLRCTSAGTGVECSVGGGTPVTETCNGTDDDCDTRTDEGLGLGIACDGADTDLCTEGTTICNAAGGVVCSDTSANNAELCNSTDDDCDTRTDEGYNLGAACDGADTDACAEGAIVCAGNGTATCGDVTGNSVESCNGLDDDCRNGVDDGFGVGTTCSVGVGACARTGALACNGGGTTTCSAVAGAPTPETCGDGMDQDCSGADIACPTNDLPTGALNISAGGVFTVDLTAARNDQDFTTLGCGLTGGRDVYYTFTLPSPEVVYLDTYGSNFDTTLRLFAGSCTALGALQSCFDDSCTILQSQGAQALTAGTYCVVADQYSSAQTTGNLVLTFTRGGRTGTAIAAASGTASGTSCSGINATTPSCQTNTTAQDAAYFFTVCPATTRVVAANTCTGTSFDSVVYMRRGSAGSADLRCSDDATGCGPSGLASSMAATNAVGPGLFWLIVDGYQAACGPYTLNYTIN